MDGLFDKYLEAIESGRMTPQVALAHLYCDVFEQPFTQKLILMFGKLVKIYGYNRVIMAILDMSDMDNINFNSGPYGLLLFFLKKRIEDKDAKSNNKDLMPYIAEVKKQIRRIK